MLRAYRQTTMSFHASLYEMIPQDHILIRIDSAVDFSFIHDLVRKSYCEYYGRPANEPELLFRLVFLQVLYNLSDKQVINESKVNLAYKWFLGLNPEDPLPDSSQLSRFRNHRLGASEVGALITNIVQQCVNHGLIKSTAIILDATHTAASTQKKKPFKVLRDAAKRLHRSVAKRHPDLEKDLPELPSISKEQPDAEKLMLHYLADLGEAVESLVQKPGAVVRERLTIAKQIVEDERLLAQKGVLSAVDPDARFGWKSSSKCFFGYKEHIAITEEEIITAVEVTPGSTDDGKQLEKLLDQSVETGVDVKEVIADTAYSGKDNLALLRNKEIQAIIPLNPVVHNGGVNQTGFQYNKDADIVICPAGERSIRKAIQGSKRTGYSRSLVFYFDVDKCNRCPLQAECIKPGAKSKSYSLRIIADHYREQIEFEKSNLFKLRIKRRPIIEHKNAELKIHHGMARARYCGLLRMRLQAVLTAFVVNAKRMVKLLDMKTQPAQ